MAIDAAGDLIETDDGGVFRRTNPQSNNGAWTSMAGNLQITEAHNVAYDTVSNIIITGNQDNGTTQQTAEGSTTYTAISTGDGGDVAVSVDPQNASQSVRYSSFQNLGNLRRRVYSNSNSFVSQTFPALAPQGGDPSISGQFTTPVIVNSINASRLIIGGSNGVYESFDQGDTVSRVSTLSPNSGGSGGRTMIYGGRKNGTNNADIIYFGDGSAIYRRTSNGGAITAVSGYTGGTVLGLITDPEDYDHLIAIDSNQVFRSTNGGTSFTDITGDLPSASKNFRCLEFIRSGSEAAIVVGTVRGVFAARLTAASDWAPVGSDIPNTLIWDMDYDSSDNLLIVSTLGRGVWRFNDARSIATETQPPNLTDASDTGISNTDDITSDDTPTFQGTASSTGNTVVVSSSLNGTLGSVVAGAGGSWTFTSPTLNEGVHQITVVVNGGETSDPLVITIDTTAPPVPPVPDLATASDNGISNSDNLTNDNTPTFLGSCEPGSTVELLFGGSVVASSLSSGTYNLTAPLAADGAYAVTARSIDVAGNVGSESSALNITIDTVAPPFPTAMRVTAATDTGLSNVDNITANTSPSISGVSDADTEVTLFVDGIVAGTHPTGGSWTLPLSSLSNGIHQVTTQVEDAAGNLSIVSPFPLTVTIDTIPPAAPTNLRLTAATDTGVSNSDNLTRLSNVTLTGNAESGARISLLRNGTAVGSGNSSGTFNIGATGLPEGTTNFSAQQTDLAGNIGPVSGVAQVQVDLTPPAPSTTPLLSPASDSGASNSDGITRFQNLVFSGSSEAGGRITLLADGTSVGTALSDGSWSLTSLAISEGSHSITARAEDRAGNTAAESPATAVTLIFSAAPPTNVSLDPSSDLGFSNTDGVTSDRTPTITGNSGATDTIELSIGDPPYETSLGSGPGGPGWMVTSSLLPAGDGIKIIKARTLDIAGNLSSAVTTQFEIRTSSPGTPIGLSLKAGSDSGTSATDKITNINTPTIRGLVNLGGQSSLRINLEANGQPVGQATVNSGIWEFPTNVLPDGVLQIRALSEDFAGNLSAPSAPLTVTIDTTAPLAPASLQVAPADDTGVSNADNITRITQPEIIGIAEPGPVVLFINGTQQPGTLTSDGAWSYVPPSALPEGVTLFSARQSDIAGNQGPESPPLAVTIDLTSPTGATNPPQLDPTSDLGPLNDDRLTSDNTPLLFGELDPGDVAAIIIDDLEVGSAIADGTGRWTFESPELTDGEHLILARRSDAAGNLGEQSSTLSITIDTDGPELSLTRAIDQSDPTVTEPIRFALAFTQPVYGFGSGDVTVSGPAGTGSSVTVIGNEGDTDYLIEISNTTGEGLVEVTVAAGAVTDLAGNLNPLGNGPENTVLKKLLPGAVSGVTATQEDFPDKVVVSWQTLAGASGYRIFRHPFANPGAATEIGQVADDITEFEDTTVLPGIWHSYWVRAEDEDGVGDFGTPASGRTQGIEDKRAESPIAEASAPAAVSIAWEDDHAGLFEGLIRDADDGRTLAGVMERVIVGRPRAGSGLGGAITATLRMNGRTAVLRGVFDTNGHLTTDLKQRDGSRIVADLQLMRAGAVVGRELIQGTVTWNGATVLAELPRAPYHARLNPVPETVGGAHTMILPALPGWGDTEPGGDGWATVNISTSGQIKILGILGDGTRFAESALLSGEAEPSFSLFAQLYRSVPVRGHFGGKMTLRDLPESDFDGVMQWRKLAHTRETRYASGFDIEVWALGSRYLAPARGERVLTQLADQEHNAELSLIGPTAPEAGIIDRVMSWQASNQLIHYGPEKLSAKAITKSGSLVGSFLDPATRTRIAFTGVAFQKQGLAAGVFLNGPSSGAVRIQPGTSFPYPGSEDPGALTRISTPGTPADEPTEEAVPFDAATAGNYGGILIEDGSSDTTGAIESVKLTNKGAISGTLWIEGVRYRFKGALGTTPIFIPRKNLPPIELSLALSRIVGTTDGFGLSGDIQIDGTPVGTIDAQRRPIFTKNDRAPQEGPYTMAMRAPDAIDPLTEPGGDAYGTLKVSFLGTCAGLVILPDGTKTSLGGHLARQYGSSPDETAEWSFHRGLYGRVPRGYFAGKLYFREIVNISDLDGQCHWVKQAGAKPTTLYPNGIDLARGVVGNRYTAPVRGDRAMAGLTDDWWNLWLRFDGPDLSPLPEIDLPELDRAITWTSANTFVYFGPEKVKIRLIARTGQMAGSYLDKASGVNVKFGGVILQKQSLVTGSYLAPIPGGSASGLFSAESR